MPRLPRLLAGGAVTMLGAAVLAAAPTVPSYADGGAPAGNCGPFWSQTCVGAAQGVLVGTETEHVAYACAATAPTFPLRLDVAETGISCYLRDPNGGRHLESATLYEPGYVAANAAEGIVPVQPYVLCVAAGYFTRGGDFYPVENPHCDNLVLTV